MKIQKEKHLLITAKSKDGVSHGIPYPMPIMNPVWVCIEAILNAHNSGKVEILVHNTAEPTLVTSEMLSKFIDYGYIVEDKKPAVEEKEEEVVVEKPVVVEKKEEEVVVEKPVVVEKKEEEVVVEKPVVVEKNRKK